MWHIFSSNNDADIIIWYAIELFRFIGHHNLIWYDVDESQYDH